MKCKRNIGSLSQRHKKILKEKMDCFCGAQYQISQAFEPSRPELRWAWCTTFYWLLRRLDVKNAFMHEHLRKMFICLNLRDLSILLVHIMYAIFRNPCMASFRNPCMASNNSPLPSSTGLILSCFISNFGQVKLILPCLFFDVPPVIFICYHMLMAFLSLAALMLFLLSLLLLLPNSLTSKIRVS